MGRTPVRCAHEAHAARACDVGRAQAARAGRFPGRKPATPLHESKRLTAARRRPRVRAPARSLKEVVYTLSNHNQNVMSGLWKDLPYKFTKKVKENWLDNLFFLVPVIGTYQCAPTAPSAAGRGTPCGSARARRAASPGNGLYAPCGHC